MGEDVTQHRVDAWLTQDLKLEWSVFDHHTSQVPAADWAAFSDSYMRTYSVRPAHTLTEYVAKYAQWSWDTTYTDGTVAVGYPDGPITLETEPSGPEGCRIVFWEDGTAYDTGLRVWAEEAAIIAGILRARVLGSNEEAQP